VILIALLSLAGLADATYLLQHVESGTPLLCTIGNLSGCNIVTTSQYSSLFGIPVAGYGALFYGFLFVLAALELCMFDRVLRRTFVWVSGTGLLVAIYLTGIQFFVIKASCVYCLASSVITLLIFIVSLALL
jgi:uncharacterized membrane protein